MRKMKYKKGAASFYIIAFSTLILLTVAMSFAAIIISQVTRTSNSDLSQSAYDSAMAGIEDAKLTYYNYQDCLSDASNVTAAAGITDVSKIVSVGCPEIIYLVEKSNSCDTVGLVLGRVSPQEGGEVMIKESTEGFNNMQQAYTCVKMETTLDNYEASLSSTNPARVVNAKFDGIDAKNIESVTISWYSDVDASNYGSMFNSFIDNNNKLVFKKYSAFTKATPPIVSLGFVQTAETFHFSDFDLTVGNKTDRGMVYLVPTQNKTTAAKKDAATFKGIYDGTNNILGTEGFLNSNDKTAKKLPYAVYCAAGSRYYCSATVKIPDVIGGTRSNDTFTFVVESPYGQATEFALQFNCKEGACGTMTVPAEGGGETTVNRTTAALKGVQVGVDSTGRANDLYRRVQARMDISSGGSGGSGSMSSIMGPLELFGDNDNNGGGGGANDDVLNKTEPVICEWESAFGGPTCLGS